MATLDLLVGATAADLSAQPGHLWMGFPLLEVQMAGIGDGAAASCSCEFRRSQTLTPIAYPGASGRGRQPCD